MPKDSVERAVKKGTGELQGMELVELTYEGIGPGGISLIVEVLTDNRNRTGGEIRNILERRGGSLGKANSVLWKFDRKGILGISSMDVSEEEIFEAGIEAGADNIEAVEGGFDVSTRVEDFEQVRAALQAHLQKKRAKPEKKWGETENERPFFNRNEIVFQCALKIDSTRTPNLRGPCSTRQTSPLPTPNSRLPTPTTTAEPKPPRP